MVKVIISTKHCKGCLLCLGACPKKALKVTGRLSDSGVEIVEFDETAGCTACALCASMCPDTAIEIIEDKSEVRGPKPEKKKG